MVAALRRELEQVQEEEEDALLKQDGRESCHVQLQCPRADVAPLVATTVLGGREEGDDGAVAVIVDEALLG